MLSQKPRAPLTLHERLAKFPKKSKRQNINFKVQVFGKNWL